MNPFRFILVNIVETLLRVVPVPTRTGLIIVGDPDRNSPVLLTCNYSLTVERVRKTLEGLDAYLLVANSRGFNVWCGATGDHFTNHDVISVLKTSGIEELVDHRDVIMPQLAATGIEANIVRKKTGWNTRWGPVYAKDIPAFIENKFRKTPQMREVDFPWAQRIEMAVAWAFPISLILALAVIPFWRETLFPLILMVSASSFLMFTCFPLYSRWLGSGGKRVGFVFFDFGRGGFQLLLWGLLVLSVGAWSVLAGVFAWALVLRWAIVSFVAVLMLSIDLMGSTPVYKSSLHEDRFLKVVVDEEKCRGVGLCENVCPRNCFQIDEDRHIATMPRADRCVQCGACIVQCPFDALCFKNPKGETITPQIIRRFKLNLVGKRVVQIERET
ncbi:HgcAB-like fusion protein [[Eubacterium] cellulosolvens]